MTRHQMSFDLPEPQPPQPLREGEVRMAGDWQVRNFRGFLQSREGTSGSWRFYVSGFSPVTEGVAGTCSVLLVDGAKRQVEIDSANRILIEGTWYGPSRWDH